MEPAKCQDVSMWFTQTTRIWMHQPNLGVNTSQWWTTTYAVSDDCGNVNGMQLEVVGGGGGGGVLKANPQKRLLKVPPSDRSRGALSLPYLDNVTGEVQQIWCHIKDMIQNAIFILILLYASLSFLTLCPGKAFLTEALVGFNADATISASGFTLGCEGWAENFDFSAPVLIIIQYVKVFLCACMCLTS